MHIGYYTERPAVWGFVELTSGNLDEAVEYINSSESVSVNAVRSGNNITWTNQGGSSQTATIGNWLRGTYAAGRPDPYIVNKQSPEESFQNGLEDVQQTGSPVVSYELDES